MSVSWYDVLGVAPDASTDEIRTAWKASIDDLEPGDRRFRLYNNAAEVLLDTDARADYDREQGLLAGDSETAEPQTDEPQIDEPEPEPGSGAVDESAEDPEDESGAETTPEDELAGEDPGAPRDVADEDSESVSEDAEPADEPGAAGGKAASSGAREGASVPVWLLAALAIAVVAVSTLALLLRADQQEQRDLADAVTEARTAAEKGMPLVFSYDYRHPEQDHDRATRVLTGDQLSEYERLWKEAIEPNLVSSKGVVSSKTLRSGVVNSDASGDRIEVLLVLSTQQANATQQTELTIPMNVTMVREDGEWLISKVCGGGDCSGGGDAVPEEPSTSPSGQPSSSPAPGGQPEKKQ